MTLLKMIITSTIFLLCFLCCFLWFDPVETGKGSSFTGFSEQFFGNGRPQRSSFPTNDETGKTETDSGIRPANRFPEILKSDTLGGRARPDSPPANAFPSSRSVINRGSRPSSAVGMTPENRLWERSMRRSRRSR